MSNQQQLPGVAPTIVTITEDAHILAVGEFFGLAAAQEVLAKTPEAKQAPGYAYAVALIDAAAAKCRADLMHRNLRAVAKAGVPIHECGNIGLRGFTIECTPSTPSKGEE